MSAPTTPCLSHCILPTVTLWSEHRYGRILLFVLIFFYYTVTRSYLWSGIGLVFAFLLLCVMIMAHGFGVGMSKAIDTIQSDILASLGHFSFHNAIHGTPSEEIARQGPPSEHQLSCA